MKRANVFSMTFKVAPIISFFYIILTIVSALMTTVASTYAIAYFVDYALYIFNMGGTKEKIYIPLGIMLFILLFANITNPLINLEKKKLLLSLKKKYKPFLLKKQSQLEYCYIEDKETYELISRVINNPEEYFVNGFSSSMTMVTLIIYIISVLGMIVNYVWWAAILILIFSGPLVRFSFITGRKSYQATCKTEKLQRQITYLEHVLSERENNDERTVFGYSDKISERWWEIYSEGCKYRLKVQARYMLLTKSSTMGLSLIAIFIAAILLSSVINGTITPGMYMGLIGTVLSVTHQMGWDMSWAVETIANTCEYINDYYKVLELRGSDDYLKTPCPHQIEFNSLEFNNVSFKYPNAEENVLKKMSFKLEKGHHYAFVGGNGAGKTTITKLLMGLYTDYEGEILINNIELRNYSQEVLKSLFSYIHQDFAKYAISLKDNIFLGNISRECNEEILYNVMKTAGLEEIIDKVNDNLDNPLGKIRRNGIDISLGQWQRVAIARTLISEAPIKIFDEPTASLDPISESNIYREFEKLMKGKTTIFISHRLGSTKISDKILVLGNGAIIEHGTHDELMKSKGQYYSMFETQRRWYQ